MSSWATLNDSEKHNSVAASSVWSFVSSFFSLRWMIRRLHPSCTGLSHGNASGTPSSVSEPLVAKRSDLGGGGGTIAVCNLAYSRAMATSSSRWSSLREACKDGGSSTITSPFLLERLRRPLEGLEPLVPCDIAVRVFWSPVSATFDCFAACSRLEVTHAVAPHPARITERRARNSTTSCVSVPSSSIEPSLECLPAGADYLPASVEAVARLLPALVQIRCMPSEGHQEMST